MCTNSKVIVVSRPSTAIDTGLGPVADSLAALMTFVILILVLSAMVKRHLNTK